MSVNEDLIHHRHLRWDPHNLWAFCYLRSKDGQIAMDSIQGLCTQSNKYNPGNNQDTIYIGLIKPVKSTMVVRVIAASSPQSFAASDCLASKWVMAYISHKRSCNIYNLCVISGGRPHKAPRMIILSIRHRILHCSSSKVELSTKCDQHDNTHGILFGIQ